jgi:DNA transformation protein and related proteins
VALSADFLAYVLEQLAGVDGVSHRRMFGGAGLYSDEFFFGLIFDDTLYLRVDEANRERFTARGMERFRPYPDRPEWSMGYYGTPAAVLEDSRELALWAAGSVAAARAAELARAARRPRARAKRRAANARARPGVKRRP